MQKPVIPLTLAYIAGLLLGHGFLYFPYTIIVFFIVVILPSEILIRHDSLALR